MRTKQLISIAALAMHVAGVACASATPDPRVAEAQVRKMLGVPADARLRYLADDGTPLTFEAFSARIATVPYDVKSDAATHVTTLQFMEVGGRREIGAVTRLPSLDLKTLDGKAVRNAVLSGKPMLVNFFFTTCLPCIREIPVLNEFARKHRELNVIALTPDPAAEVREFATDRQFTWPIAAEAGAVIAAAQVRGYPTYLLVSKDGRILGRGTGLGEEAMNNQDVALEELEAWVAARIR